MDGNEGRGREAHHNNASKRPPGRCDCARVKRNPERVYYVAGAFFWENISGIFSARCDTKKTENKNTRPSHTQQQHCSSNRCWSCRNPAAPRRRPAPIMLSTDDHPKLLGESLRRPGQAAPTTEGTPAPGPSPAADRAV